MNSALVSAKSTAVSRYYLFARDLLPRKAHLLMFAWMSCGKAEQFRGRLHNSKQTIKGYKRRPLASSPNQ